MESTNGRYQRKVEQLNDLIENFGFKSLSYSSKEFITDQLLIKTVKYPDDEIKKSTIT